MEEYMSEKDFLTKTLTETALTRRSFLKWSAALGGAAALAGGVGFGLKQVKDVAQAAPEGEWITAACWHNCGGQRCVLKANVIDGVVQKVKTDDTNPDTPERYQVRACARGRAQQQQTFGADRLKYPMIRKGWQTGGGNKELRGKDEWVRISWEEALDILASEITRIQNKHGKESILSTGGTLNRAMNLAGGTVGTWGTTSWGTWFYTGPKIGLGDGLSITSHNDRFDLMNSELVVIWGGNPAWSAQGNNMWYYHNAKKAGAKFIFLDPFYNDTAMVLADDWVPVRPGTDHALALGMVHTLLVEDDPKNNPLIDWDFLNRCTLGFDKDHMPEGADPKENLRDYVLGIMDNQPKTPEWASEICGVDPTKIRQLAREIARTKRVALLTAWSPARTNSTDSWPQIFMTLGAMTGHIGQPGRMTGVSCWEKTADGGPALVGAGGAGVPGLTNTPEDRVNIRINNNELWDAVLSQKYTAGYQDVRDINIQMIIHDGGSALNQKVGATKGIAAHRKVEFVVTLNLFLNPNASYSDLVLPVTTQWERYGLLRNNRGHLIWARQITEPLFEAKDDIWIAAELGKRLGFDPVEIDPLPLNQQIFNQLSGAWVMKPDGSERESLLTITQTDISELGVEGEPQRGRITLQEFKQNGVYVVPRNKDDALTYIAHQKFREDPEANPLGSISGKLEIHCQDIVDFVKNSGFDEIRPIPAYRRPIEGYEDTFSDWGRKIKGEFPLQLFTIHHRRRSHSIFDNIPWLRELFPQEFLMNPIDAQERGISSGDVVKITSRHGSVIRHVHLTDRLMPGVVSLGEGAWIEMDEDSGIDKAGSTNILNGAIPTGQGHQGWNTCIVQIEKYGPSSSLLADKNWPQRIPIKEA
jgi:anaerobic dimethyl sulfoxide reductase subunit A